MTPGDLPSGCLPLPLELLLDLLPTSLARESLPAATQALLGGTLRSPWRPWPWRTSALLRLPGGLEVQFRQRGVSLRAAWSAPGELTLELGSPELLRGSGVRCTPADAPAAQALLDRVCAAQALDLLIALLRSCARLRVERDALVAELLRPGAPDVARCAAALRSLRSALAAPWR
ncbi:MAG: hypothetical protein AB7N76_09125 [Planctomycetota bacterium]